MDASLARGEERRGVRALDPSAELPLAFQVLVFGLVWAAFAWPWLSHAVTIPWDAKAQFLPQTQFLAHAWAQGESPAWAPYVFSGVPQIADPQSMLFSPPFVALAFFNSAPGNYAGDVTIFVCVLLAGLSVLWLAHDVGWHGAGGLIASLTFCFGAAMAWRLQHWGQVLSLAYLPLTLILARRALLADVGVGARTCYGAGFGVMLAFIVLGRDQVGLLEIYCIFGFLLAIVALSPHPRGLVLASLWPMGTAACVTLAITIVPILLTVLHALQSNRPTIDLPGALKGSLHPALLTSILIPHLYGPAGRMEDYWGPPSFVWEGTDLYLAQNMGVIYIGVLPAFALLAGLTRGLAKDIPMRLVWLGLALTLLYTLGRFTPAFRLMYETLSGVDRYRRPADAVFMLGALMSAIAGFSASMWARGQLPAATPRLRLAELALIATPFAFAAAFGLAFQRLGQSLLALGLAAGFVAIAGMVIAAATWLRPIRPRLACLLVVAATGCDLILNNGPNGATALPPAELAMLEPDHPPEIIQLLRANLAETAKLEPNHRDRAEIVGLGFHWPNAGLTYGIETTLGYNPVRFRLYANATGAGNTVGLSSERAFSPLFPTYSSQLARMLGLSLVATAVPLEQIDPALTTGDFKLLAHTAQGYLYGLPGAFPRATFAVRGQDADFADLIKTGIWPKFDAARTVLLEHPPADEPRRPGSVTMASITNTEVNIETQSPDGGYVVLYDLWAPWWEADVDGIPTPIQRANVLFRAVAVDSGRHIVRFHYRPLRGAAAEIVDRLWGRYTNP